MATPFVFICVSLQLKDSQYLRILPMALSAPGSWRDEWWADMAR